MKPIARPGELACQMEKPYALRLSHELMSLIPIPRPAVCHRASPGLLLTGLQSPHTHTHTHTASRQPHNSPGAARAVTAEVHLKDLGRITCTTGAGNFVLTGNQCLRLGHQSITTDWSLRIDFREVGSQPTGAHVYCTLQSQKPTWTSIGTCRPSASLRTRGLIPK